MLRPFILSLCLLSPLAAGAGVELTPDQAREAALAAFRAGDLSVTEGIAVALVQRDPADVQALLLLGAARLRLGDARGALAAAAAAWAHGQGPERYEAARLAADAEIALHRPVVGQFWLRRAYQTAPSATDRDLTAGIFRALRRQMPLRLRATLAVRPTSNANGGSAAEVMWIGGLPFQLSPSARAVPGLVGDLGVDLGWTPAPGTTLSAHVSGHGALLGPEARASAPGLQAELASARLGLAAEHVWNDATGATALTFDTGRSWAGGAWLADTASLTLSRDLQLGDGRALRVFGSVGRQWNTNPARDARLQSAGLVWAQTLTSGGRVQVGVTYDRAEALSPEVTHHGAALSASYAFGRPALGADWGLAADFGYASFPASSYATGARNDLSLGASLTGSFGQIGFIGFSPQVTLGYTATRSNVALFEQNEISVTIGLKSQF